MNRHLYSQSLKVIEPHFISSFEPGQEYQVKIRYQQRVTQREFFVRNLVICEWSFWKSKGRSLRGRRP